MKKPTLLRTAIAFPATFVLFALSQTACDPKPQCSQDIELGANYHVTLVAKTSPIPYIVGNSDLPSCTGLDSLEAGFALDIAIPENGPHPEYDEFRCWIPEGDITSDVGLTLVPDDGLAGFAFKGRPMFVRTAKFSIGDCMGGWSFMAIDESADPYNGTPAHRWAGRLAWFDLTAACQAAFPGIATPSSSWCYDEWDIDLQTM